MPRMEALETLDLNMLAMYCVRVAKDAAPDSSQAEQARQLKTEWDLFIGHLRPPIPGLETEEDIRAHGHNLKQRMVEFLKECSASLFLTNHRMAIHHATQDHVHAGGRMEKSRM